VRYVSALHGRSLFCGRKVLSEDLKWGDCSWSTFATNFFVHAFNFEVGFLPGGARPFCISGFALLGGYLMESHVNMGCVGISS